MLSQPLHTATCAWCHQRSSGYSATSQGASGCSDTHACTHKHTYSHAHTHKHTYSRAHTHTPMHAHTNTHTQTHEHTHTHTLSVSGSSSSSHGKLLCPCSGPGLDLREARVIPALGSLDGGQRDKARGAGGGGKMCPPTSSTTFLPPMDSAVMMLLCLEVFFLHLWCPCLIETGYA